MLEVYYDIQNNKFFHHHHQLFTKKTYLAYILLDLLSGTQLQEKSSVATTMDEILTSTSAELFSDEATTDLSWLSSMTSTATEDHVSSPTVTSSTSWGTVGSSCFFEDDGKYKRKCSMVKFFPFEKIVTILYYVHGKRPQSNFFHQDLSVENY